MNNYVLMVAMYVTVHNMNISNVGLSEKNTCHDRGI